MYNVYACCMQILGMNNVLGTVDMWPVLLALTIIPAIFQVRANKANLLDESALSSIPPPKKKR